MIMTEKKANKKFCPTINNSELHPKCVASGCMAWRWRYFESLEKKQTKLKIGYCGLADKPPKYAVSE